MYMGVLFPFPFSVSIFFFLFNKIVRKSVHVTISFHQSINAHDTSKARGEKVEKTKESVNQGPFEPLVPLAPLVSLMPLAPALVGMTASSKA